jgi:Zn finger protein HypA/HybF involved in hydrogenase expression
VHDYHAVSALVASLTADPNHADDILEVRVQASPVFSPEALLQAYEMLAEGTALAGSRLSVEEAVDRRECPACGHGWTVSRDDVVGHLVVCPSCGVPSQLGDDIGIELLEIRRKEKGRAHA